MPKGLTARNILDTKESIEVVLDLLSFSGGENTIGEDHELEDNESSRIENWESTSLGGMIRNKGITSIASGLNVIEAAVFTGSGLNDATKGGTYTGVVTAIYTIIIDATGTPDTFKWKKDSGNFTTGVSITASAQTLSDGVTVTFAATTGHTLSDQWVITGVSYANASDLIIQHFEGVNNKVYGIIEGDLVILSSADIAQEDLNAFTSGVISHAVSAGSKLWITNTTDNLQYKTIGQVIATPTTTPTNPCARIFEMNFRLIAEGDGAKTVYGSIPGTGNWVGAGGWTTSNSAWSMVMPDLTFGAMPGFPSGTDLTVFTEFDTFIIYNQPNVSRRRVPNGIGCSAPLSIAKGNEGIFFVSKYPTLGVYVWNGVEFINLTEKHNFVEKINFSKRIFGIYRDRKYYLFYNDSDTTDAFPNRIKVYDTKFGRWHTRKLNADMLDNLGYPTLLTKTNNELYVASAKGDTWYSLDDASTSDNGNDTEAVFETKIFTSRDFRTTSGGQLPLDNIRIKLLKAMIISKGAAGDIILSWTVNHGLRSGQQSFNLTAVDGNKLNIDFILNTSLLVSFDNIPDKRQFKSFNNSAVGKEFQFQILNNGTGLRTEVKRLKIHALLMEDN